MTVPKRTKRAKPDPELVKLADSLLANYKKPEGLIGENGLLKHLTKMLVERALETEMTEHLGHDRSGVVTNPAGKPDTPDKRASANSACRFNSTNASGASAGLAGGSG